MKKIVLYILILVGMFFVDGIETHALKCKVGEGECADKNTFIESIKEETNGGNVVCLYEVNLGKTENSNEKYYNYIYYDSIKNILMGGTTYKNNTSTELKNNSNAYLLGDAYNNLFQNYVCPKSSYIEKKSGFLDKAEVCFDNNNEGKDCNKITKFNDTYKSDLIFSNPGALSLKDLSFKNACNRIPDGYDKVCRYSGKQDTVIIYYNSSSYQVQYKNDDTGQRVSINKGESKKFNEETIDYYTTIYDEYVENLTTINSCPENIYVNKYSVGLISDLYQNDPNAYQYKYSAIVNQWAFEEKEATPGKDGDFTIGNKEYQTIESRKLEYNKCDIDIEGKYQPDPESCEDLFDEELLNIINEIMNIIKIAIPILLIGLIIFDFASAIFASSDDKVNKAKQRAIKRVIIAVVIFFVPTLINFVLNLVNDVWGKNYEICGIEEKTE